MLIGRVKSHLAALPSRSEDRVHEIRVSMKKVRALVLLTRPAVGREAAARAGRRARDVKNHFGSLRDADVLRDLLLDLLPPAPAAAEIRRLHLEGGACEQVVADGAVAAQLDALLAATDDDRLHQLMWPDVVDGWLATYRKCRRASKVCRCRGTDGDFHSWRKRVKELLYQSEILSDAPEVSTRIPAAEKLSSLLGKHHDLSMLCERFENFHPDSPAVDVVRRLQAKIARRAFRVAGRLLNQKPSAIRRKLP